MQHRFQKTLLNISLWTALEVISAAGFAQNGVPHHQGDIPAHPSVRLFTSFEQPADGNPATSLPEGGPVAAPPLVVGINGESADDADAEALELACGGPIDLREGAVFTQLNTPTANQVLAFGRTADGSLCEVGRFDTRGTSDPAGMTASGQNSVIAHGPYLFVVNSGSAEGPGGVGSLSVFRIEENQLILTDVEDSGGAHPRSVTRWGDLVYVVNAGISFSPFGPTVAAVPENVQGFHFDAQTGALAPIPGGSINTLAADGHPAQISFDAGGTQLLVAQRRTYALDRAATTEAGIEVISLGADGLPTAVAPYTGGGLRAAGFRIDGDQRAFVMHADPMIAGTFGVSVHQLAEAGGPTALMPGTSEPASASWNYIAQTVPVMFGSSFFDSAVVRWDIQPEGGLKLRNENLVSSASVDAAEGRPGGGLDIHGTVDALIEQEYVYVLNNPVSYPSGLPASRIVAYRVEPAGDLTRLGESVAEGIPDTSFGLWVR